MAGHIVPYGGGKLVLTGTKRELPVILASTLAYKQMIDDRDIGDIVGYPVDEWVRKQPVMIRLSIMWMSVQYPPFTPLKGQKLVRSNCKIPDVDVTRLNWLSVKTAAGGAGGRQFGNFLATAKLQLKNGNISQMQVYGATQTGAINDLKKLQALSTSKIISLSCSNQIQDPTIVTDPRARKHQITVYPAYFAVLNSQKIIGESNLEATQTNYSTLTGDFVRHRTKKIPLWVSQASPTFQADIQEALRNRAGSSATNFNVSS
jgi:hypothetical protein